MIVVIVVVDVVRCCCLRSTGLDMFLLVLKWRRRARWLERSPRCLGFLLLCVARLSSGGSRDGGKKDVGLA